MRAGKTMRGRGDDEDDDRPLLPTGRGYTTRGNTREFSRRFRASLFRPESPSAPRKAGMAWTRRMDEGPDPDEIEDPGRD
jgi:hypothetical protein